MADKVFPDVVEIELRRGFLPRINYVNVLLKYYEPTRGLTEETLDVRSVRIDSLVIERVTAVGERGLKVTVSLHPNTVALYDAESESLVVTKQR